MSRKVTKVWTMKGGEKIRICDMTVAHLLNTIKMLERAHASTIGFYLTCAGPNGDMARDCFDAEFDALDEGGPSVSYPIYDDLCDEATRRGLDTSEAQANRQLNNDLAILTVVATAKRRKST